MCIRWFLKCMLVDRLTMVLFLFSLPIMPCCLLLSCAANPAMLLIGQSPSCALHTNQPQMVEVLTSKKRPRDPTDDLVLVLLPDMLCMQQQSAYDWSRSTALSHDKIYNLLAICFCRIYFCFKSFNTPQVSSRWYCSLFLF